MPVRTITYAYLALLVSLCAVLVVACGDDDDRDPTAARQPTATATASPTAGSDEAEAIVVGAAVSLTGATSTEGQQYRNGYELWAAAVNDAGGILVDGERRPVTLRILDDESDPTRSATLARQLLEDEDVDFLLGPYGTGPSLAVREVAEELSVPLVIGIGAAEAIFDGEYTFGVMSTTSQYLHSVFDFAVAQTPAPATVAILSADDEFSRSVAASGKAHAEELGLEIVYEASYPRAQTDLRSELTELQSARPDIVINAGYLQEAIALRQQAVELAIEPMLFVFTIGPALPEFVDRLGEAAENVVTGSQWSPAVRYEGDDYWGTPEAYATAYREEFGEEAAYQAASATAAALALQHAIEAAGSLDPEAVRDALAALDIETFYGPITFDERGINVSKPMVVEQIQGGERVTIWPSDIATADAVWPAGDY